MLDGIAKLIADIQSFLPHVPELLLAFVVGYIVIHLVLWASQRIMRLLRFPHALITITRTLISVILWITFLAYLLQMVGLSQIAITLSGSLLIIGFAIANGTNTLVGDIVASLFLAKDPDFNVGYLIKFGEYEGIVESIDIRKTRLLSPKGTRIVIPNAVLDKEHWEILGRPTRIQDEKSDRIDKRTHRSRST